MTFWIKLEDEGRRRAPTPLEVEGDVKCLADKYAGGTQGRSGRKRCTTSPPARSQAPKAPLTGSDGMVIGLFLISAMRPFKLRTALYAGLHCLCADSR